MLEIEFVDRSVALAGKAFVSFFPTIIVVSAFMPESIRDSILTTLNNRLGMRGDALVSMQQAFASADDVRRATGILGLVLAIFYATSFTTALQRVYLRAWRRPPGKKSLEYVRGPAWFLVIVIYWAALGGLRALLGDGPQIVLLPVVLLVATSALWWFTAWFMLLGQVRWRVLVPCGVITGVAIGRPLGNTLDAKTVTKNQNQFGFSEWRSRSDVVLGRGDLHARRSVRRIGTGGRQQFGRRLIEAGRIRYWSTVRNLTAGAVAPGIREAVRPIEDEVSDGDPYQGTTS
jgi:hypothetical protein